MPVMLSQRDVIDDVKTSFSSWDNCMEKAYCKWPAIVGIIVGAIVLISVVWCIVSCVCCGASCCCGCLSCCKSCGPSRRRKGHAPIPHAAPYIGTQYQAPQPLSYGPPQFARFDASSAKEGKPYNEDALPAMPGWDTAVSRKVEDTSAVTQSPQDVELNRLDQDRNDNSINQRAPMLAHADGYQNPYQSYSTAPNEYVGSASAYYSGQQTGVDNASGYDVGYGQTPYNDDNFAGYATPAYAQSRYAPSVSTRMGSTTGQINSSPYDPPVSPIRNSYGAAHLQQPRNEPIARKPLQGSWREI